MNYEQQQQEEKEKEKAIKESEKDMEEIRRIVGLIPENDAMTIIVKTFFYNEKKNKLTVHMKYLKTC
ncbi:MAG: hypothetical protein Fur0024_2870 [Patescibacteria group bacterium]